MSPDRMKLPTFDAAPDTEVTAAYHQLALAYRADPFPTVAERDDRLERLERLLVEEKRALVEAVDRDFSGRSPHETLSADVLLTLDSVRFARRKLQRWMRPRRLRPAAQFLPARTWVEPQPLGVVGIIAPWNYPVNLALAPMAGALAAGNRVLLKPSELTPRTAELLCRSVRDRFTAEEVAVVTGGPEVARAVASLPLDHLLFTGSTQVGRQVAASAAANLTPVTLELGGKSPVLIHPDYPIEHAAERVALGKLFNGGQTCIAPDYVLLPEGAEEAFASAFRRAVSRAYPDMKRSKDYTAIASDRGYARLRELVDDAVARSARVEWVGGEVADLEPVRRLPAALLWGGDDEMRVMREEIFGPILPIRTVRGVDEAIAFVNARPRPLALYYFDRDTGRARDVLRRTVSGGACINDTLLHFAQEVLPFGGVGHSGMGAYHGRAGFDTFSHRKPVLAQSRLSPVGRLMAPPYGKTIARALDWLISR